MSMESKQPDPAIEKVEIFNVDSGGFFIQFFYANRALRQESYFKENRNDMLDLLADYIPSDD